MSRITAVETVGRFAGGASEGGRYGCGKRTRVRVTLEDGESFILSGLRARRLGIEEGADLPDQVRSEIMQQMRSACLQRCGKLLGSRDYSVDRLRTKLQEAGYPASVVEDCIDQLKTAHYLDDRRYAQTYVRSHLHDRSRLRISHDLAERGIAADLVEEAFAEIAEETDPDEAQLAQIRRLLQKRGYDPDQGDYALRQKTMAFLHRKGYETGLIRRAMDM